MSLTAATDDYSLVKGDDDAELEGQTMTGSQRLSRQDQASLSLHQRLARPSPTVWLSGQEAAEYVGVSWPTLRQAMIDHAIPRVRLGTLWRIEVAVLDEHLRRLAEAPAASR